VTIAATVFVAVSLGSAIAHDAEPTYDRITLSASAEREVKNDLLVAVLFAEHQASLQQKVSETVNAAIRWALDKSKETDGIKVQTMQYSTASLYDKKIITGWRAHQSIRIESKDAEKLSDLIGELQERLSVGSVNYAVSKAERDLAAEALTAEALAQYRRRVEQIARELGRKTYRIVQLNINSQGVHPRQIAYATRGAMAMEEAAGPAIEAGVQSVSVNVSGTIEVDAGSM
jgi:predicted secreted protein